MGKFAPRQEHILLLDLHNTADAAFSVDMDLRIVAWNHAAESLLGIQAEEAIGRKCSDVMTMCHPGDGRQCPTPCAAVANTRRGRPTPSFTIKMDSKDSSARWLSLGTLIAHTPAGQSRVIHFVKDVSTHHVVEDRVAELSRAHTPKLDGEDASMNRMSHTGHVGHLRADPPAPIAPRPQLTQRELEVLQLVASGLSNSQIAAMLSISPFTVRNHITNIAEKLGVKTRLQAVVAASLQELI